MENKKYTKEEKRQLQETLEIILKDIRTLWAGSKTEKISLWLSKHINKTKYKLTITEQRIFLCANRWDPGFNITLEKRNFSKSQFKRVEPKVAETLINEYDSLRRWIIEEINEGIKEVDVTKKNMDDIKRKYSTEVDVELDFPRTQNMQSIELLREDGKNIGVINFGERSIRIITNGNITLIDNSNKDKKKKIGSL